MGILLQLILREERREREGHIHTHQGFKVLDPPHPISPAAWQNDIQRAHSGHISIV